MLLNNDKKKIAAIIISRMKPSADKNDNPDSTDFADRPSDKMPKFMKEDMSSKHDNSESEYNHAEESAGEDMINAMESKDAAGLAEAVCALIDIHMGQEKSESSDVEDTEDTSNNSE